VGHAYHIDIAPIVSLQLFFSHLEFEKEPISFSMAQESLKKWSATCQVFASSQVVVKKLLIEGEIGGKRGNFP